MNYSGVIYDIQDDKAIILTGDRKFVAIKKRDDMIIGQTVKFDKKDIYMPKREVYKYSPSSKRIEDFSRVAGIKNFSRVNNIKNFSRVNNIKNFSRVNNIKNFSRVSNIKNFSRISDSKDSSKENKVTNFSRITRIRNFSRIAGIAAAFIMIFMFSRFTLFNNDGSSEYAYVGVDINPSVEFVIDSGYRVIEAIAVNEDARQVLDGLNLENMPIQSALTEFIAEAESCGFIIDDSENVVIVSMALNDDSKVYKTNRFREEEKLEKLKDDIEDEINEVSDKNIIKETIILTPDDRKKAKDNDISMGRYSLYLEAEDKGIEVTIDQIRDGDLEDIIKVVKEEEQVTVSTPTPVVTETPIPTPTPEPSPSATPSAESAPELSIKEIAAFDRSVVIVASYNKNKKIISQGSGFCVAPGLFVTNYHVIEDAVSIKITTNDEKVLDVEGIVKYDKAKDLVVLKTVNNPGIEALKLGTKASLQKGDKVVAVGSPQGLKNTVSEGIVSGFRTEGSIDVVQITVPISNGSSGGPLFDMRGRVVGITSYGISRYNLNFAIPIDFVTQWVRDVSKVSFKNLKVARKTLNFDGDYELNLVVFSIINALENEDIEGYFNGMTKDRYSDETKNNLDILFKTYDLIYNIESIEVVSQSAGEVEMNYVYSIYKEKGPEFKNCRITGKCTLKKIDGLWKIYKSDEQIQYIK